MAMGLHACVFVATLKTGWLKWAPTILGLGIVFWGYSKDRFFIYLETYPDQATSAVTIAHWTYKQLQRG